MTRPLVLEHLSAFNAHDTARLLAGFTDTAVWRTGVDEFRGRAELTQLFDAALWALDPSLHLRSLVADERAAGAQLTETLLVDGEPRTFEIAAFFSIEDGLITSATVYREGSADLT